MVLIRAARFITEIGRTNLHNCFNFSFRTICEKRFHQNVNLELFKILAVHFLVVL